MGNLRIILCAESTSMIIGPIRSRCLLMRVGAPESDEVSFRSLSTCISSDRRGRSKARLKSQLHLTFLPSFFSDDHRSQEHRQEGTVPSPCRGLGDDRLGVEWKPEEGALGV